MCNGASGCGYEYTDSRMKCGHLNKDLLGFSCLKYRQNLNVDRITGHPFRCSQCSDKANGYHEARMLLLRAEETKRVRELN